MKRARLLVLLALAALACSKPRTKTPTVHEAPVQSAATGSSAPETAAPGATLAVREAAPDAAPDAVAPTVAAASEAPGGPIDRLVARLNQRPLWDNGSFRTIRLSRSAPIDDVVKHVFSLPRMDRGGVSRRETRQVREVRIGGEPYTAVLVDTNRGRKIVLLRYQGPGLGWWSRVFDASSRTP